MNKILSLRPLFVIIVASLMTPLIGTPPMRAADTTEGAGQAEINSIIIQFNGAKIDGVTASTGDKDFRPVFEKELVRICGELTGKPAVKIKHWYTVINGAALTISNAPADTTKKLMEVLQKQKYVKTVELDAEVHANAVEK